MKNHLGRLLLVLLIVALSVVAIAKNGFRLGLDLAGGASITYEVSATDAELTRDRIQRVIDVVEQRLNATGLAEISITPTQQNEIVVELPGRSPEQIKDIKRLIEQNGQLEFRLRAEATFEREQEQIRKASGGLVPAPAGYSWVPQKDGSGDILVRTPEKPLKSKLDRLRAKGVNPDSDEFRQAQNEYDKVVKENVFRGDDIVRTGIAQETLQIVVVFELAEPRKPFFGDFTGNHVGEQMAIILDGKVMSAPVIRSRLPGHGQIEGGSTGFTQQEAHDLAVVLESGATGVQLTLDREESLGPSLGQSAIDNGKLSVAAGVVLVVVLMLFYYRLPGMVANLALFLNLVTLLGVLAFFHAALTLPGIAGIVLTLGMSVDANILVFERYREERHRGKSVAEAIAAGYDRAMSAIVDSNATTILTAVVLIAMGTGAVKGFGVSLTIGLLISMFTAIYVTRWIFEWAVEKGVLTDLRFGPGTRDTKIDFMGKRAWFTGPSFVLMIAGAVAYLARDDYAKRDLEFVGGQEAIVHLQRPLEFADAERRVAGDDGRYRDASVVTLAPEGVGDVPRGQTNRFRVRVKAADSARGDEFLAHLASRFADVLLPPPFTDVAVEPLRTGGAKAGLVLHLLADAGDPAALQAKLIEQGFTDVAVTKVEGDARALRASMTDPRPGPSVELVKSRVAQAAKGVDPPLALSDPFPSKSFLEASRAEELFRSAVGAVLVSLLIQLVYIRLRFPDFNFGVAAVVALAHDVPIALGAVALFDATGLVYAKLNLVLIAGFLTLIGYSMNDTIVIFDRIRENLGRSRVVLTTTINDAVNQTLARTLRTGITTWLAVLVQFVLNRGTGSVLEGFAFVMVVGIVSGTYSSVFIAAPLLLFLPIFWRKFTARPRLAALQVVATPVGSVMAMTAKVHDWQLWVGVLLAFNIMIQFLWHFFPWLGHRDPDSFVREQVEAEERERPVAKPGI